MAIEREVALAFVHVLSKSPKTVAHLEAQLGYKNLPSPEDFDSNDPDTLDRAEDLMAYIGECCSCLLATLHRKPRQGKLDLGGKAKGKKEAEADE